MLSVDENLLAALGILCCSVAPPNEFLSARRKQLKIGEVAIEDRELRGVFLIEGDRHVRTIRFQLRNFAGYFDRLSDGADIQLGVYLAASIGRNLDGLDLVSFETGCLDANVVHVWNQMRNGVVAVGVCCSFFDRTFRHRRDSDLGASDCGALLVGNGSEYVSV